MWLYCIKGGKDYLKCSIKHYHHIIFLLVQQIIYYKCFKPYSLSLKLKLVFSSVRKQRHKWRKKVKDGRDIFLFKLPSFTPISSTASLNISACHIQNNLIFPYWQFPLPSNDREIKHKFTQVTGTICLLSDYNGNGQNKKPLLQTHVCYMFTYSGCI